MCRCISQEMIKNGSLLYIIPWKAVELCRNDSFLHMQSQQSASPACPGALSRNKYSSSFSFYVVTYCTLWEWKAGRYQSMASLWCVIQGVIKTDSDITSYQYIMGKKQTCKIDVQNTAVETTLRVALSEKKNKSVFI